jgi:hypothetical protein
MVHQLRKTVWWFLKNKKQKKQNIELPYDLKTPLIGTCPKELKIGS